MSLPQQLPQLLEHLMSLKDYYQDQLIESEQKARSAQEQLSHVNALLLDQLGDVGQFVETLIELRSHLQTQVAQNQQQAARAREQLSHAHALLADQIELRSQQVSIPAAIEPEQKPPDIAVEALPEPLQLPTTEQIPQTEIPPASDTVDVDNVEHPTELDSDKLSRLFSTTKTQMLPQYQQLSKIQAVERLLRENASSILHVDYIIRALYGELDASAIKAEKPRMYDTLTQGTKKGLWVKVPDVASCYTYDLKLVQPNSSSKNNNSVRTHSRRRTSPARGKQQEQMLPDYQHLNLTAAVEAVVNKYAGEILTTERIAKELYGEISGRELTQAKDKIGKTL